MPEVCTDGESLYHIEALILIAPILKGVRPSGKPGEPGNVTEFKLGPKSQEQSDNLEKTVKFRESQGTLSKY